MPTNDKIIVWAFYAGFAFTIGASLSGSILYFLGKSLFHIP
jgi:hypothetical protein